MEIPEIVEGLEATSAAPKAAAATQGLGTQFKSMNSLEKLNTVANATNMVNLTAGAAPALVETTKKTIDDLSDLAYDVYTHGKNAVNTLFSDVGYEYNRLFGGAPINTQFSQVKTGPGVDVSTGTRNSTMNPYADRVGDQFPVQLQSTHMYTKYLMDNDSAVHNASVRNLPQAQQKISVQTTPQQTANGSSIPVSNTDISVATAPAGTRSTIPIQSSFTPVTTSAPTTSSGPTLYY